MTIVLNAVRKVYPSGFVAVKGLDLQVRDGEFFTLLGPSGCGKTTTLRMIAGLEQVSSGSIWMKDRDVTDVPARHRDVAMVFQSYALYPHMTVRQNLGLNLEVHKHPRNVIRERVAQVARMLQLDDLLDRKPGQLSGGQRQRVALGRAVIRRPNVFLMDEPLSNLDLKLREETRTELKKLHEELRITTVYVSHDQGEALVLSDRIGVMRDGELLQIGNPHEVYSHPADTFVARFIGSPSINLLAAALGEDVEGLWLEITGPTGTLRWLVSPDRADVLRGHQPDGVIVGVRPEDLAVRSVPAPGSMPAVVVMVQPMGSVSYALLQLPGDNSTIIDRDHLVAAISPEVSLDRGATVWLGIRGERYCVFSHASGKSIDAWQT